MTMTITELRALVLAHPDLAAKLCQPPLGYQRPDQWNGFVPPEFWQGTRNDSPRRAALVAIIAEAQSRQASTEGTRP